MGLLKNLLESVAGIDLNKVKEAINNMAAEQGANQSADPGRETPSYQQPRQPQQPWQDQQPWQNQQPAYRQPSDGYVRTKSAAEWRDYFRGIIQAEFPYFSLRENVPVTEIAGPIADEFQLYKTRPRQVYRAEWGQPYTFVLYQGSVPRGVVMLGAGKSHAQNVKYLIARMFAKRCRLPYINFYIQMPNERNYVVSRLHRFLG